MFKSLRQKSPSDTSAAQLQPSPAAAEAAEAAAAAAAQQAVVAIGKRAAHLGREAAEVRGALEDTGKIANTQATAVQAAALQLKQVVQSQAAIAQEVEQGLKSVALVGDAVHEVGVEVGGIVKALQQVSEAAQQITQVALQTRLVAFNASVEAKRAGDAGRGFAVVADAVKDLAAQVEQSSKAIMGTVGRLDSRIVALARVVTRDGTPDQQGAVHRALGQVEQGVRRIHGASAESLGVCQGLDGQMGGIVGEMQRTTGALDLALKRTETFLGISEQLFETVVACGVQSEQTPYVRAAQLAASQVAELLEASLRTGAISETDLFDERYQPVPGSNPAQVTTRFVGLAERLFPQVQEKLLSLSDKVVYAIAADRNGYIACHNSKYNQAQRSNDPLWNTANCRNRRVFNDRTGLASARNQRPFLLQTYRRDMGGGQFVVMMEVAAPITVAKRHWGGLRLAFKF